MSSQQSSPRDTSSHTITSSKRLQRYYILCSVCLFFALILLWGMVTRAQIFVQYGLLDQFYYIPVVLLAVCAALTLFGFLQSRADVKGAKMGLNIKLGGPAGFAVLIILFAKLFFPPALDFDMTVYVHALNNPSIVPLKNTGTVTLCLENDPRTQPIGSQGAVLFRHIPAEFRGLDVLLRVENSSWQLDPPQQHIQLQPYKTVSITVKPKEEIQQ